MKTILRKIAILAGLCTLTVATAKAQTVKPKGTLGFNLIYSKPQGDFKKIYKYGMGGEAYGGVESWDKTFIIATIGYRVFGIEDHPFEYTHVKLGVKHLFLMKRIFVQADAGISSVKYAGSVQTAFAPDFGAGVRIGKFELGLFYDTFKWHTRNISAGSFNAKAGFNFSL